MNKNYYVLIISIALLFLLNKYSLLPFIINTERIELMTNAANTGLLVKIFEKTDLTGDHLIDTFALTEIHYSGNLDSLHIIKLINIRSKGKFADGFGIIMRDNDFNYWTTTDVLNSRRSVFSFMIIERRKTYSNRVMGLLVLQIKRGRLLTRVPTLYEFARYRLGECLPSAVPG